MTLKARLTWSDGDLEEVEDAANFNPNHDELGRFAPGTGGQGRDLTPAEQDALETYVGGELDEGFEAYRDINDALRDPARRRASPEVQKAISDLDSAFAAPAPLVQPAIVYRGARDVGFRQGDVIVDKAFVSTSTTSEGADTFMRRDKALMVIHLPPGARVLNVGRRSTSDFAHDEHEVLLPRGSRFRVRTIEVASPLEVRPAVRGVKRVELDLLLPEASSNFNPNHDQQGRFAQTDAGAALEQQVDPDFKQGAAWLTTSGGLVPVRRSMEDTDRTHAHVASDLGFDAEKDFGQATGAIRYFFENQNLTVDAYRAPTVKQSQRMAGLLGRDGRWMLHYAPSGDVRTGIGGGSLLREIGARYPDSVVHFNPNHDELGRFSDGSSAGRALTPFEEDALRAYALPSSGQYRRINGVLREGKLESTSTEPELQITVKDLDKAFSAAVPLAQDAIVYRGVHDQPLQVGDVVVDQGYTSTTRSQTIANRWASQTGKVNVAIRLPPGARVLDVSKRLKMHTQVRLSEEVLLPRGSRFRVTGRGPRQIDMELLLPEGAANFNPHHDELGRFAPGDGNPENREPGRQMTDAEETALTAYVRDSEAVNSALRGKSTPVEGALRNAKLVQSAFDAVVPLAKSAVVYRGMPDLQTLVPNLHTSGPVTITDKAFVSTSLSEAVARKFVYRAGKVVARITLPKGARVLNIGKRVYHSRNARVEQEVLLPSNSRFRVDRAYSNGASRRYDMTLLLPGEN